MRTFRPHTPRYVFWIATKPASTLAILLRQNNISPLWAVNNCNRRSFGPFNAIRSLNAFSHEFTVLWCTKFMRSRKLSIVTKFFSQTLCFWRIIREIAARRYVQGLPDPSNVGAISLTTALKFTCFEIPDDPDPRAAIRQSARRYLWRADRRGGGAAARARVRRRLPAPGPSRVCTARYLSDSTPRCSAARRPKSPARPDR